MSGAFATLYSWTPICVGAVGLLVAVGVATLWAEAGDKRPPPPDDSDDLAEMDRLDGRPVASRREERDEAEDDRPLPEGVRRDCEPDRGTMLLWLGRLSLWLIVMSFVLGALALVTAVPLAIVILVMASRDRAKMRAGTMDPAGERLTGKGARYAAASLVLIALIVFVGVGCLVYVTTSPESDLWSGTSFPDHLALFTTGETFL
jgi:hypothetical protein